MSQRGLLAENTLSVLRGYPSKQKITKSSTGPSSEITYGWLKLANIRTASWTFKGTSTQAGLDEKQSPCLKTVFFAEEAHHLTIAGTSQWIKNTVQDNVPRDVINVSFVLRTPAQINVAWHGAAWLYIHRSGPNCARAVARGTSCHSPLAAFRILAHHLLQTYCLILSMSALVTHRRANCDRFDSSGLLNNPTLQKQDARQHR